MLEPDRWIENGTIEITGTYITRVGKAKRCTAYVDHGSGVILPALVNAHTHVGLSGLDRLANSGLEFTSWVKELIRIRNDVSPVEMNSAADAAAVSIRESGTGFVAEVGAPEPGMSSLENAGLDGIIFVEVLGNCFDLPPLPPDSGNTTFSFAGHALHTTGPATLRALKGAAVSRNRVFSVHLAESDAETEFLRNCTGPWADLLDSRGIDYREWNLIGESPVKRAERLGLLGPGTLAVHALDVNRQEREILARSRTSVCFCPRSNAILHGKLPDIPAFLKAGIAPALGTDSLASNASLSLFDEMAFVAVNFPGIRPEIILSMASCFGADVLGRNDVGRVQTGKRARLIYVNTDADSAQQAARQLVADKPEAVEWL
ncbi:MAG TPA: amidohydrolase family protein [Desulfomonilaceae bacterium]|nr:amidohydrolase family protein [Desulfomonilaceae bacterium]